MKKTFKKGFTMIELLIVIAVLGVLATAVLSAINPIEQINRGRDTGSRSDAEQVLSAVERFYTAQQYFPWMTGTADLTFVMPWTTLTTARGEAADEIVDTLSTGTGTEELKLSFATRLKTAKYELFIYHAEGSQNSTYVCFLPKSGSFKKEADDRCDGTVPTDYPASACVASNVLDYICLP